LLLLQDLNVSLSVKRADDGFSKLLASQVHLPADCVLRWEITALDVRSPRPHNLAAIVNKPGELVMKLLRLEPEFPDDSIVFVRLDPHDR
jgi:hypothetical protein